MNYTIYKTTNLVNGKIYIGKHITKDPNDEYLGSGRRLTKAKAKYGTENFTKEVLFIFNTEEEMNSKEAELVTEEFCSRLDTYNICPGGKGGFGYIHREGLHVLGGKNAAKKLKGTKNPRFADWHKQGLMDYGTFRGRSHTDETKAKMRLSHRNKHSGEKNSQFGTCWVQRNGDPIKIKTDDLERYLADGYLQGRKLRM